MGDLVLDIEPRYSPAATRDDEVSENLARETGSGPLARVKDSFEVKDREGSPVKLTLLRVVDAAEVRHSGGTTADHFPIDLRGDWYAERRYVGIRLRLRYLDPASAGDIVSLIGQLLGAWEPMRLVDHEGTKYRPDSEAWTIGANPIENDQVRIVARKDASAIAGTVFPVPEKARLEYLRVALDTGREWQLGPATRLSEGLAEYALALAGPAQLIRYAAIAIASGFANDKFVALAQRAPSDPADAVKSDFESAMAMAQLVKPSLADAARTLRDAYLREIIEGRIAPAEGVRRINDLVFPRVQAELGKEEAWELLGLRWLFGPYLAREYSSMDEQDEKDALIIEECLKLRTKRDQAPSPKSIH